LCVPLNGERGELSMEFCMVGFEKALGKKLAWAPEWMNWDGEQLKICLANGKWVAYHWKPEKNGEIVRSAKLFIKSKGACK